MFRSANYKTLGAKFGDIGFTVFLMWSIMLLATSLFKVTGLANIDFSNNPPFLGFVQHLWLDSQHLTFNQVQASTAETMNFISIIIVAPFIVEEIVFRAVPWYLVKDGNGGIKPGGMAVILAISGIGFGLAHGHGIYSLMVQGVGGLFLVRLFCRSVMGENWRSAYFSAASAHSLYNITCVVVWWLYS